MCLWIVKAERPAMSEVKPSELLAVLPKVTASTNRVTNYLKKLRTIAMTDYMLDRLNRDDPLLTIDIVLQSK